MAIRPLDTAKLLIGRATAKGIFLILRFIWNIFQTISWKMFGIQDVSKISNATKSKHVAQALRILAVNKFCYSLPPSLRDSIVSHDEYINPDYVINNDHVTLFFLDPHRDVAVFGEGRPGQLLWHSDCDSHITNSLFKNSKRLIVMPMDEFHKVCARLPDPNKPLVILGNTARCGSTLLTQIFECTNKIMSYSEPKPLNNLAVLYKHQGMSADVIQLTRSLVRMYARPLKTMPNPEGCLLKPAGPAFLCAEPICRIYPNTPTFYLYRNMDSTAKSLYKLSYVAPYIRLGYLLCRIHGDLVEAMFASLQYPTKGTNRTVDNDYCCGVFIGAITANVYKMMRANGGNVHGLVYEDLIQNKESGTRAIFRASGIPMNLVNDALTAFTRDSQRNGIYSRETFARIKPLDYTMEDKLKSNKILTELGYPTIEPYRLEGTLTF
ncbi:hypothetical protein CAPTEDRAFT_217150 [Capitella teleta]|uniref:Sulfotransferase domain-containing protein n=1 Tax=Capitella teleta TaxID=283909 RepID=R7VEW4_CAPTE|nr:hypothetical protein CAPTEDRAFT_217150 [Capitella teleta]|eukprot:ELU17127.1 hypothetical protein CAPTEDRAFT_217150 [Capitella teleta]